MADAVPLSPLPPDGDLEQEIARALGAITPDQRDIVIVAKEGQSVRSSYLRWLLLRGIPASGGVLTRFELRHATVTGDFDLRAAHIGIVLRFVYCCFPDTIYFTDAKLIGADFVACTIESISGDRLSAAGSLRLLAPKFVDLGGLAPDRASRLVGTRIKQIRLCGAHIHGNLDLRGSILGGEIKDTKVTRPLFADGITVDGNVLLSKGLEASGEICLNGSTIRRNLDCSGAKLVNHNAFALSAAGAEINGAVLLCRQYWRDKDDEDVDIARQFQSEGVIRLDGAKISGDLDCQNGKFTATAFAIPEWHPDIDTADELRGDSLYPTHAIKADGVHIGADVVFTSDGTGDDGSFNVSGTVSMISAHIGGDFNLYGARFNFPGEEAIVVDGITVEGASFLDGVYSNGVLRFVQATLKQGLSVSGATFDVTQASRHWTDGKSDTDEDLGGRLAVYMPPLRR